MASLVSVGAVGVNQHAFLVESLLAHEQTLAGLVEDLGSVTTDGLVTDEQETITETIRRLQADRSRAERADEIGGIYDLAYELLAVRRERDAIEAIRTRIEEFEAERALVEAHARFERGEALIGRGLEGLAAWFQEGLTQADIAAILGGVGTIAAVAAQGN